MALWYHKALSARLQQSPDRWLYRNRDRVLDGTRFAAACLYLRQHVERAASADGYVLIRSDKHALLLPAIVSCGLLGYSYVPVASDTPVERLATIKTVLGVQELLDLAALEDAFFKIPPSANSIRNFSEQVASSSAFPDSRPLYVLFTSGSSGTPKGVMISPHNVRAFMAWACEDYAFDHNDILLGLVPETFDLSVLDIYACLGRGAQLVAVERRFGNDTGYLVSSMREFGISSIFATPSLFNLLRLDRGFEAGHFPRLRQLLCCGEVLQKKLARALVERLPGVTLFNLYGPTETCVAVTSVLVDTKLLDAPGPLPVGRARGNTACIVVGEDGQAVAEGEPGELVIVGETVGCGYLGLPELTAQSFYRHGGRPAYRSGDQAKQLAENIYFLGRNDDQIKWSGYRIEPGEIEVALKSIAEVEEAVVIPGRLADGTVINLVAVIQCQVTLTEQYITDQLAKKLPQSMLPSAYRFCDKLPLTAHGKLDRNTIG